MCVKSVIIMFVLFLGTHTHFNLVFYFQVFTKIWEEARLGLVLVTEGLVLFWPLLIFFFNYF